MAPGSVACARCRPLAPAAPTLAKPRFLPPPPIDRSAIRPEAIPIIAAEGWERAASRIKMKEAMAEGISLDRDQYEVRGLTLALIKTAGT